MSFAARKAEQSLGTNSSYKVPAVSKDAFDAIQYINVRKGSFVMFDGHASLFSTIAHVSLSKPYANANVVVKSGNEPIYETVPFHQDWYQVVAQEEKDESTGEMKPSQRAQKQFAEYVAKHFASNAFIGSLPEMQARDRSSYNVKVANLDAGWDDKDDEEALLGIRHELEQGIFDFAYIYLTGPSCNRRAAHVVSALLKGLTKDQVRVTWLPVTCKDCHAKFVGVAENTGWAGYGKCPAVCGIQHMDNKLDLALHNLWQTHLDEINTDIISPLMDTGYELDCDDETNVDHVIQGAFLKDLEAHINPSIGKPVKVSLLSAAPMTGVAELFQAINEYVKTRHNARFVSTTFMGSVMPVDDGKKNALWNLDGCSNWYFHPHATSKFFNMLKHHRYRNNLPKMLFFASRQMQPWSVDQYAKYVLKQAPGFSDDMMDGFNYGSGLRLLILERSMFTTARIGVQGMAAAVDIPNRCFWLMRMLNMVKGTDNGLNPLDVERFTRALSDVVGIEESNCQGCLLMTGGNDANGEFHMPSKMGFGGNGKTELFHWAQKDDPAKSSNAVLKFVKFTNIEEMQKASVPSILRPPDSDCRAHTYDKGLTLPTERDMNHYEVTIGEALKTWADEVTKDVFGKLSGVDITEFFSRSTSPVMSAEPGGVSVPDSHTQTNQEPEREEIAAETTEDRV
eukprot:TRINITY_DN17526_c0_g5_i1.p1 TRINITY_DN17526_c0_g5~~TRINITY_DN17526_c0_g5_i1.p1  ORF type:complete len:719 (-),score=94.39 TRINITY_DN17526_c0_g5_i1:85-2124(-)